MKERNHARGWSTAVALLLGALLACQSGAEAPQGSAESGAGEPAKAEAAAPARVMAPKLTLVTNPAPPTAGQSTITITVTSAAGAPIEGAKVAGEFTMTHPGMKPEIPTFAPTDAQGQSTSPLNFTMGGDWIFLARITLAEGQTFEQTVNIPGVRTGG